MAQAATAGVNAGIRPDTLSPRERAGVPAAAPFPGLRPACRGPLATRAAAGSPDAENRFSLEIILYA